MERVRRAGRNAFDAPAVLAAVVLTDRGDKVGRRIADRTWRWQKPPRRPTNANRNPGFTQKKHTMTRFVGESRPAS